MKIKHIAALVTTIIFIAGWPLGSLASDSVNLGGSEVSCTVQEKYEFSIPEAAEISYPQTSVFVGEFVVGDILLKTGETLSVNLSLGLMKKIDNQDELLTYNVIFSDPGEIDRSKMGCAYGLALSIDSAQFDAASFGTYSAPLFRVVSNTTGEVVWEQTIYLEAIKHNTNEGNQNQNVNNTTTLDEDEKTNNDSDDDEANLVADTQPDISIPATADEEANSVDGLKEDINEERTPLAQPDQKAMIYWIIIACGVIIVFCFLYLLIRYRNSNSKS